MNQQRSAALKIRAERLALQQAADELQMSAPSAQENLGALATVAPQHADKPSDKSQPKHAHAGGQTQSPAEGARSWLHGSLEFRDNHGDLNHSSYKKFMGHHAKYLIVPAACS